MPHIPAATPQSQAWDGAVGTAPSRGKAIRLLAGLGSPRWMLAFFVFAFAGALTAIHRPAWLTAAWAPPLAVFALSLVAAVVTNPRFRRDMPLLGLHLGLLALVVLIVYSRLTYLDGAVTLTQGTAFSGALLSQHRGPLHPDRLDGLRFVNEGVYEVHEPNATRPAMFNRVRWWDSAGRSHVFDITDNAPLQLAGYRIFQTRNRGYSAVLAWQAAGGEEDVGSVQLSAGSGFAAANTLRLADGREVWIMLDANPPPPLPIGQRRDNLGAGDIDRSLTLRVGERRETLRPGESMDLGSGRLRYLELNTWMGYRFVYDVAVYWMAAAVAVAIGSMIWFYARVAWRVDSPGGEA